MTCDACTNARAHPLSGRYGPNCDGCVARGISRMPQYFKAVKEGRFTPDYRQVLADQLPKLTQAEAHAAVKAWAR